MEAITLLTPAFTRLPQAFAPLMQFAVNEYQRRCEAGDVVPDQALLAPILALLDRLQDAQKQDE